MSKKLINTVATVFYLAAAQLIVPLIMAAENEGLSEQQKEALALGLKVIEVKAALEKPEMEGSIDVIKSLGQDSRYYVMVRGWIRQHIEMTESYQGTSTYRESKKRKKEVDGRITALKKMLRAIDLE